MRTDVDRMRARVERMTGRRVGYVAGQDEAQMWRGAGRFSHDLFGSGRSGSVALACGSARASVATSPISLSPLNGVARPKTGCTAWRLPTVSLLLSKTSSSTPLTVAMLTPAFQSGGLPGLRKTLRSPCAQPPLSHPLPPHNNVKCFLVW